MAWRPADEARPLAYRTTCAFCDSRFGRCSCFGPIDDEPDLTGLVRDGLAFDTGDMIITHPNLSECGRFFVEPALAYGLPFVKWATANRDRLLGRTISHGHVIDKRSL